jgi:hypothetical protein
MQLIPHKKILGSNTPFIPRDCYDRFDEIRRLCIRQYNHYTWCGSLGSKRTDYSDVNLKIIDECYQRTDEISQKQKELIETLRKYLENLDAVS